VTWRGVDAELEETGLDFPTLGIEAWQWIEEHCVIPDGDQMGEPFRLTDEMLRFLVHYYRVDPTGKSLKWDGPRFHYARGGQLVRPQKWGKGPFSAAIILFEACGPALPDGWDADGVVVGRPWPTPHIQITAISEDQTQNVYRALLPMIRFGPLDAVLPDTGLTRINVPGGGLIEPVTASAMSRLGQRVTFVLGDETHGWVERNGGKRLADNQRRNLSGMGGRFLETTNAWSSPMTRRPGHVREPRRRVRRLPGTHRWVVQEQGRAAQGDAPRLRRQCAQRADVAGLGGPGPDRRGDRRPLQA
jgi:hypothetical protein